MTGALGAVAAAVLLAATPTPGPSLAAGLTRTGLPSGQASGTLTDFAFLPGGIVTTGKGGRVSFVSPGARPVTLATIPVDDHGDLGLIGIEVARDVQDSGTIYTAYTHRVAKRTFGRVSAWKVDDPEDPSALSGERVLLDRIPVNQPFHSVNTIAEAPDGSLFVSVGDGGTPARVDRLALRAQDPSSPNGKLLRVLPDGRGHPENPWFDPSSPRSWRSRAWAIGLRNPFRFAPRPGTSTLLVGDVGWREWEEVDLVERGDNLGWPCWEGEERTRGYHRLPACRRVYRAGDPEPPVWSYTHGRTSASITGGVVLTGYGYPSALRGKYAYGDFVRQEIRVLDLGSLREVPGRVRGSGLARDAGLPVRFRVGPEGDLYYADLMSARVWRLRYGPSGGGVAWPALGVGVALAAAAGAAAVRGRRRGRHSRRGILGVVGSGDAGVLLAVAVVGAAGAYVLSGVIGTRAWYPSDVWFQADIPRIVAQMTELNLFRARLHPLFPLLAFPLTTGLSALGLATVTAVRGFIALGGAAWLVGLFAVLRAAGCRRTDAALLTAVGAVSGSAIYLITVPETFALGGASILLVLLIVARERDRRAPVALDVAAASLSMGFTLTNGMAAAAAAVARRPWRRSLGVLGAGVALMVAIVAAMALAFPAFRAVPSVAHETRFVLLPAAGGPVASAGAFLLHPMVVPEIERRPALSGATILSVQRSVPGTGTPAGPVALVAWIALLGTGTASLFTVKGLGAFRPALGLTLAGQLALHLVYGEEVFLFSPHFLPLLVLLAGLGTLTRRRRLVLGLSLVLLATAAVNNAIQLGRALEMVGG